MRTFKSILFVLMLGVSSIVSAKTIEMDVNGLVCAFCAQGIEKSLKALPPTSKVFVSLENKIVAVELKDGTDIADAQLRKAITDAGFTVVAIRRSDITLDAIKQRVARQAAGHE
jgi:mercuric ion binding protein